MESTPKKNPKALTIIGWILTVLPALFLLTSGISLATKAPFVMENIVGKYTYTADTVPYIGIALILSVILYLVPRTAILGAILLTGYLGGATATHVIGHVSLDDPKLRIPENQFIVPVIFGMIFWLALVLRIPALRALLPWRCPNK